MCSSDRLGLADLMEMVATYFFFFLIGKMGVSI
jgi:hypothetical protein